MADCEDVENSVKELVGQLTEADKNTNAMNGEFETAPTVNQDSYELSVGESLSDTLDITRWDSGVQLTTAIERLEREIAEASATESEIVKSIRERVFPQLHARPGAPESAGVYSATSNQLEVVQKSLLYNGLTEACDGTSVMYETLPIQIIQIAVAMVSYQGTEATWSQRIFRRDMRMHGSSNIADKLIEILNNRARGDNAEEGAVISDRLRRAVMTCAERAVLADMATAPWRIGHGNPIAFEIITGSGMTDIIKQGVPILDQLILRHKKFLFVTSETSQKHFLTIGNALRPGEYAVIDDAKGYLEKTLAGGYRGEWAIVKKDLLDDFAAEVGPSVVCGVYKSSVMGPAHLFYAHKDYVHEAALLAMADSVLQEHRNFPMLIDLADGLCSAYFGAETLNKPVVATFAQNSEPYRYLPERKTR